MTAWTAGSNDPHFVSSFLPVTLSLPVTFPQLPQTLILIHCICQFCSIENGISRGVTTTRNHSFEVYLRGWFQGITTSQSLEGEEAFDRPVQIAANVARSGHLGRSPFARIYYQSITPRIWTCLLSSKYQVRYHRWSLIGGIFKITAGSLKHTLLSRTPSSPFKNLL